MADASTTTSSSGGTAVYPNIQTLPCTTTTTTTSTMSSNGSQRSSAKQVKSGRELMAPTLAKQSSNGCLVRSGRTRDRRGKTPSPPVLSREGSPSVGPTQLGPCKLSKWAPVSSDGHSLMYGARTGPLARQAGAGGRSNTHHEKRSTGFVPTPGSSSRNPPTAKSTTSQPVDRASGSDRNVPSPKPQPMSDEARSSAANRRQDIATNPPVVQHPPRRQQYFSSDPSQNLLMAVECHRATAQDEDGDTPLHIALSQERVEQHLVHHLVELIRLAGKSVDIFNDMRQTPLHVAAIIGNPAAVRILVEHGSNPNETDHNGNTAMHNVCSNPSPGSCDTLRTILRYTKTELNLDCRNYGGFTPLHISVKSGLFELSKLLIEGGASTNSLDAKSGWTPLFHAVTNQDSKHIRMLLGAGAQVNMQSYSGNTALHVATGRGYKEIVRQLMQFGADMSLRNTHKDTAVMVATDNTMSRILRGVSSMPSSSPCVSPHYSLPITTADTPPPVTNEPVTSRPDCIPTAPPHGAHQNRPAAEPAAWSHTPKHDAGPLSSAKSVNDNHRRATASAPPTPNVIANNRVNCRVSVIVTPKSLKRRLIERTEREESNQVVPDVNEAKTVIKKRILQHVETRPRDTVASSGPVRLESRGHIEGQSEPMDLTKANSRKANGTVGSDVTCPHGDRVDAKKIRDDDDALCIGTASADNKAALNRVNCDEGTKTSAQRSFLPKEKRKRKRSERLPPKKRK